MAKLPASSVSTGEPCQSIVPHVLLCRCCFPELQRTLPVWHYIEVLLTELAKKQKVLGLKTVLIPRGYDCLFRKSKRLSILVKLIRACAKESGNKIIIQKIVAFLYTSNEQLVT